MAAVPAARPSLSACGGLELYCSLMREESYWQVPALEALMIWAAEEESVEQRVVGEVTVVRDIVAVVEHAPMTSLPRLIAALGRARPALLERLEALVGVLLRHMQDPSGAANERIQILRLVRSLYQAQPPAHHRALLARYPLRTALDRLVQDRTVVVLHELASQFLPLLPTS